MAVNGGISPDLEGQPVGGGDPGNRGPQPSATPAPSSCGGTQVGQICNGLMVIAVVSSGSGHSLPRAVRPESERTCEACTFCPQP